MTAKEYLGQAYHIDERIESKLMQIESLKSLATRVTSVFSDMPHSSTPDNHRLEKIIADIIDLENEILNDVNELVDSKREVNSVINSVENPEHRTLLEMRYLSFQTWEQIAVKLGYDSRHIRRIHGNALQKIKISEKMSANVLECPVEM
ncbi:MAG: DUF1492 domain-containing protein [Ruminococcus sp.]|nr:DUF1492 domain-containing protein [Ruminococcus sp.]